MSDPVTQPSTTEAPKSPAPGTTANPPVEDPTLLGPEPTTSPDAPKDGEPAPDDKPKEPEGKKGEVPEKYEVKLPEGKELDTETLDLFTPIFKELGLDNAGVQKLVDVYAPMLDKAAEKQRESSLNDFKEIVSGWKADTMKMLGSNAKEDLAACGRALNKFGNAELRVMLQETGVGNHPLMVKFMTAIGKTISEDTIVDPKEPGHNLTEFDPRKMYPSMPH